MMPDTTLDDVVMHCCGIEDMSGSAPEYMQVMIAESTGVSVCARCGSSHSALTWIALDNPVMSAPDGVTPSAVIGYAMCPIKSQPIFLTAWDMGDDS